MDFDFSAQDQALWKRVGLLFAEKRFDGVDSPVAAREALMPLLPGLSAAGYLNIALGRAADGEIHLTAAMEKVAGHCPDLFLMLEMSTRVFGRVLRRWGNPCIKAALCDLICKGKALGTVALCEGAQNTDATDLTLQGTSVDGRVHISGEKSHVLNAAGVDYFAVIGRLADETAVFVLPRQTPGLRVGPASGTLGGTGVWLGPITLDDCVISEHQVLVLDTEKNPIEIVRMWENQVLCAAALADMGRCFDLARTFADSHHNGGKPIIAHQAVAFKLAEMYTLKQTAQLLAYHAGWSADNIDRQTLTLSYCAKVFCTEAAERIASEALQVMGVHGCAPDGALAGAMGRGKFGSLFGTSSEIARNTIGDALLKYVD
jgi:alkylation response protein AidB-like acyl-CoA dehydrogenase